MIKLADDLLRNLSGGAMIKTSPTISVTIKPSDDEKPLTTTALVGKIVFRKGTTAWPSVRRPQIVLEAKSKSRLLVRDVTFKISGGRYEYDKDWISNDDFDLEMDEVAAICDTPDDASRLLDHDRCNWLAFEALKNNAADTLVALHQT